VTPTRNSPRRAGSPSGSGSTRIRSKRPRREQLVRDRTVEKQPRRTRARPNGRVPAVLEPPRL
jgi:hypothetical protein